MVVFVVLAFAHSHRALGFSWSWLWFSHFGSAGKFADGALVAAFYYWGWDVSSNLGEETAASERNSGAGGVASVIICLILFELFTIVMNMDLSQHTITSGSVNPLQALGGLVGHSVGAKLMIVALMLSTIATLETTIIQVTRSSVLDGPGQDPAGSLRPLAPRVEDPGSLPRSWSLSSR